MSDFICYGYKQMAQALKDAEGKQMYSSETVRKRFGPGMKEAGILFNMTIGQHKARVCVWHSNLRDYIRLRGGMG